MPMIDEKRAIIAKIEGTYGTDAVPSGATNAILAKNITWTPLSGGYADRAAVALPSLGRFSSKTAIKRGMIEFDVELTGTGTLGTPPPYGPLLRACGLSETIVAVTSVTYAPVSGPFDSVSIYANIDGLQQKLLGCRGSVSLSMPNEQIPMLHFKLLALYALPTDTALPALTLTAFQQPLPFNRTNTTPISLHGFALGMQQGDIDLANDVQYQSFPGGSEQVFIVNRAPIGKVEMEHPTMAAKDFFTLVDSAATGAFTFTHGTVATNKIQLNANQVRLTNPTRGNVRGIATLKMDLELAPSNALNDEFSLVYT
jgi:hypothetical protein